MGNGKCWKTEGGQGGKRGHSNMAHRETTAEVKNQAKAARRIADRQIIADEIAQLQEENPTLTEAQIQALLRETDA